MLSNWRAGAARSFQSYYLISALRVETRSKPKFSLPTKYRYLLAIARSSHYQGMSMRLCLHFNHKICGLMLSQKQIGYFVNSVAHIFLVFKVDPYFLPFCKHFDQTKTAGVPCLVSDGSRWRGVGISRMDTS